MYLQGNLQLVFDALYHLGVIDPVLEMDWSDAMDELPYHYESLLELVSVANTNQDNLNGLMANLKRYDEESLSYLAMEVAREFADFHTREELH